MLPVFRNSVFYASAPKETHYGVPSRSQSRTASDDPPCPRRCSSATRENEEHAANTQIAVGDIVVVQILHGVTQLEGVVLHKGRGWSTDQQEEIAPYRPSRT